MMLHGMRPLDGIMIKSLEKHNTGRNTSWVKTAHLRSPASQEIKAGASAWTKPNRKQQGPWRNNTLPVRPGQHPQVQASQPWPSVIPFLFAQICLLKAGLLCWDNTNIYWAFCTRQTLPKPFACICALNPQISLWGKLANSVLGEIDTQERK